MRNKNPSVTRKEFMAAFNVASKNWAQDSFAKFFDRMSGTKVTSKKYFPAAARAAFRKNVESIFPSKKPHSKMKADKLHAALLEANSDPLLIFGKHIIQNTIKKVPQLKKIDDAARKLSELRKTHYNRSSGNEGGRGDTYSEDTHCCHSDQRNSWASDNRMGGS